MKAIATGLHSTSFEGSSRARQRHVECDSAQSMGRSYGLGVRDLEVVFGEVLECQFPEPNVISIPLTRLPLHLGIWEFLKDVFAKT